MSRGSKRTRRPSVGELDLWRTVAQSVKAYKADHALPGEPKDVQASTDAPSENPLKDAEDAVRVAPKATKAPLTARQSRNQSDRPREEYWRTDTAVGRLSQKTPGLDRNTARRLKQGRVEPDARLDLHGMTAEQAHNALRAFIFREQMRGGRCVLVITGKGGRFQDDDFAMRPSVPGQGVLKTLTPQWLSTPPLSQLVVGVYQAHVRHGGAGALYVYLRKNR